MLTRRIAYHLRPFLWCLLLVVVSRPAKGQLKVSLEEYETTSSVFRGEIGDLIPVTFNLNVHTMSSGHRNYYSIEGWYQYDKFKEKIPLVGMNADRLFLYHFEDQQRVDTVLDFKYDGQSGFWNQMEQYAQMDAFREKITLEDNENDKGLWGGWWTNGVKKLPIKIYGKDIRPLRRHSILKIENEEQLFHVDLVALDIPPYDNSVYAYQWVDGNIRVVLNFVRPSKAYAMGMCGAGEEDGFLWLEFDENGHLLEKEELLLNSCLLNLSAIEVDEDEEKLSYLITGKEGGDQILSLNKKTLVFEWRAAGK